MKMTLSFHPLIFQFIKKNVYFWCCFFDNLVQNITAISFLKSFVAA